MGVRVAIRSFAPLFSGMVALVILNMYPAALVRGYARALWLGEGTGAEKLMAAAVAFALAAWAAPRVGSACRGWVRHLPLSGAAHRRGVAGALLVVELPLAVLLALLAFVAARSGGAVTAAAGLAWGVVLVAAALAATPVVRQPLVGLAAGAAALAALYGGWTGALAGAVLAAACDPVAGELRGRRRAPPWRDAGATLDFRIAWRALGRRIVRPYVAGSLPLAAAALFLANNSLPPHLSAGAARFGGVLAMVLFLSGLSERLAVARPVWPWARSLPWSAAERVVRDALFLGAHALPLAAAALAVGAPAALAAAVSLPLLALRAAGVVRVVAERRTGSGGFVLEGTFAAALAALVPWSLLAAPPAAIAAFFAARELERGQKVTRWLELRHAADGDPLGTGEP